MVTAQDLSSTPIKNVSHAQIEGAISKALTELTGADHRVSVVRLDHDPRDVSEYDKRQVGVKIARLDLRIVHDAYADHEDEEDDALS